MAVDELLAMYRLFKENLVDLVSPDRGSITTFYEIARDHVGNPSLAKSIAEAILDHLQETTPGQKLPALYVLDMIAKNEDTKLTYRALFEQSKLPQVVAKAWMDVSGLPEVRVKFVRVVHTWRTMNTFSSVFLDRVDAELSATSSISHFSSGSQPNVRNTAATTTAPVIPTDPRRRPPAGPAVHSGATPALQQPALLVASSSVSGMLPPPVVSKLPGAAVNGVTPAAPAAVLAFTSMPSAAPTAVALPQGYMGNTPLQHVGLPAAGSVLPIAGVAPPVAASLSAALSSLPSRAAAFVGSVSPSMGVVRMHNQPVMSSLRVPSAVSTAAMMQVVSSMPQPAATMGHVASVGSLMLPAGGVQVLGSLQTSSPTVVVPERPIAPSGVANGVSSAAAVPRQESAAGASVSSSAVGVRQNDASQAQPSPQELAGNSSTLEILSGIYELFKAAAPTPVEMEDGGEWSAVEFPVPAKLKAHQQSVVDDLLEQSRRTRPKLLDLQFRKNSRKRSQSSMSRQWFVTADSWLSGTAAASEAPPVFFDDQNESNEAKDVVVHRQRRDDSKKCCAISGEEFDMVYDDTTEQWWFVNCVQLDSSEAATYGLPEGSYVKATALTCASDKGAAPVGPSDVVALSNDAVKQEPADMHVDAGHVNPHAHVESASGGTAPRSPLQSSPQQLAGLKRPGSGTDFSTIVANKKIRV